ncbi:type IV secretion system protein VirB10 [Paraburkholderia sp. CNPSo 3076]|uniref:type IV secretion system protein VirB10 n=1 Tax=Paraburkholderia sp. CNPSo 3076 TaxID=2940936 RepID=UPI00225ABFF4|nr:type IV secretion system protein VirB10 [Paraburkholderia sp. CNPSo 3076]MCX5544173.1 type IV secretion system protein VirB10 [Paraburkholderia sp. CNPSo 3076]
MSDDINLNGPNLANPTPVDAAGIGERGVPGVGRTKRRSPFRMLPIVIGMVLILLFGAIAVGVAIKRWSAQHHAESEAARAEAAKDKPSDDRHDFARDKAKIEKQRAEEAAMASEAAAASAALATPAHANVASAVSGNGAAAATAASAVETPAQRKLDGDVLLTSKDERTSDAAAPGGTPGLTGSHAGFAKDGLDSKLQPSKLETVKAELMPSRDFLLIAGTTIPCVQSAEIVTDYPGMTTCHVAKDVYSANGTVLLVERGSEVVGEQRQALMQGQARIFVIWTRLTTPDGVKVQLDSPAADALGGSGLPAYVDNHFWTRFGGAMMVSLISDAGQALSTLAANSGSSGIQFNNTTNAGGEVAAEALRNTINVPPTAYSQYGSMTTIFVARDVDFSDVYELVTP